MITATRGQQQRDAAPLTVEELVERNLEWAAAIGREVQRKLPPSFDAGDLEQVARIEMWNRATLYDAHNSRGTPFRAFAYQYVRGACLMSVRRRNWRESTADPIPPRELCAKPLPDQLVAAKQQHKNVDGPRQYRQRTWLLGAVAKLNPLDAYLILTVYIRENEVAAVALRFGMEPAALARRLTGIVKRLRRARACQGKRKR